MSDINRIVDEVYVKLVERIKPPPHVSVMDTNEAVASLLRGSYDEAHFRTMSDVVDYDEAGYLSMLLTLSDVKRWKWLRDDVRDEMTIRASIGRKREAMVKAVLTSNMAGSREDNDLSKEKGVLDRVKGMLNPSSSAGDVDNVN